MINFSVILGFDAGTATLIGASITALIAFIIGIVTVVMYWKSSNRQQKQQDKQHEEKMEYMRLIDKKKLNQTEKQFILEYEAKYQNKIKNLTKSLHQENLKYKQNLSQAKKQ